MDARIAPNQVEEASHCLEVGVPPQFAAQELHPKEHRGGLDDVAEAVVLDLLQAPRMNQWADILPINPDLPWHAAQLGHDIELRRPAGAEIGQIVHQVEMSVRREPVSNVSSGIVVRKWNSMPQATIGDNGHVETATIEGDKTGSPFGDKLRKIAEYPALLLTITDHAQFSHFELRSKEKRTDNHNTVMRWSGQPVRFVGVCNRQLGIHHRLDVQH